MNNIWEHLARGLAAVGGFIAGLYGGWSGAMTVLVIFMVADYVLGCTCALTGRSTKTSDQQICCSYAGSRKESKDFFL